MLRSKAIKKLLERVTVVNSRLRKGLAKSSGRKVVLYNGSEVTLLHELLHLALRHQKRAKWWPLTVRNIATDLVVNTLLRELGYELPKQAIVPEMFGLTRKFALEFSVEELCTLLSIKSRRDSEVVLLARYLKRKGIRCRDLEVLLRIDNHGRVWR